MLLEKPKTTHVSNQECHPQITDEEIQIFTFKIVSLATETPQTKSLLTT